MREGQPYELNILASGTEPISYQWYKDGIKIENATAPNLKLREAVSWIQGGYHVVIGNEVGEISTENVLVEVLMPPSVGELDELMEVYKGTTVSITAPVSGYGTFNYQWLKNGVNIPGATDRTIVLANVATSDSGNYSLNVGSEGGALYSNSMNFRVLADEIMLSDNLSDAVQLGTARGEVSR